ncbi:hypothetical protein K2X85_13595 [bacterium]|nr:hypothetical protein [bacterium]
MSREQASDLAAMLILGGSVRGNPFEEQVGRSVMDLPLSPHETVLDRWYEAAYDLTQHFGIPRLPVRVTLSPSAIEPTLRRGAINTPIRLDRDAEELRGPGGALADVAAEFPDDALILAVSGFQIAVDPVPIMVAQLFDVLQDGAILAREDGHPVTLFLLRCGSLRDVPSVGFVDFKEQVLPRMAESFDIRVVHWPQVGIQSIRTLEDYLACLRLIYSLEMRQGHGSTLGRPHEPWRPIFSIVEPGGKVADGVDLLDSVVLRGGEVEEGAVVVRSIVAEGGVVRAGKMVEGQIVRRIVV